MTSILRSALAIVLSGFLSFSCEVLKDDEIGIGGAVKSDGTGLIEVAVGAVHTLWVVDACKGGPKTKRIHLCWDDPIVSVRSVELNESLFALEKQELTVGRLELTLRALKAGNTTLTVSVVDEAGETKSATAPLSAVPATVLYLNAEKCMTGATLPRHFPVDTHITLQRSLYADEGTDSPLAGTLDLALEPSAGSWTGDTYSTPSVAGPVTFQAPGLTVKTHLDGLGSFTDQPIEIYDLSAADAVLATMVGSPSFTERSQVEFSLVFSEGMVPCIMTAYNIQATVLTPAQCSLSADRATEKRTIDAPSHDRVAGSYFFVYGTAPGICQVEVRLVGSDIPPAIVERTLTQEHFEWQ